MSSLADGLWLLVSGCWPLAAGLWLLASGYWSLATGLWPLAAGLWLLTSGCWPLAAGLWLLAAGCWLLAGKVQAAWLFRAAGGGKRAALDEMSKFLNDSSLAGTVQ